MSSIPDTYLYELRQTLLQCAEYFGSNNSLRDLFSDESIAPFGHNLPERDSLAARVDALIAHLVGKKRSDGRSALPLFLKSLSQKYHPSDQRHPTLKSLADRLAPPAPPSATPLPNWNSAAIRQLLNEALDDQSLNSLAFDHFRPVYNNFGSGLTRTHKIQLLLEYCMRHNQVESLLHHLEKLNPTQFRQHQPYQQIA